MQATRTRPAGRRRRTVAGIAAAAALLASGPAATTAAQSAPTAPTAAQPAAAAKKGHRPAYLNPHLRVKKRVADLLRRMTLAEKIGQMTQAERNQVYGDPSIITDLALGSVLSGGGSTPPENTPEAWADMVDTFQDAALQTRLRIPLIYGVDAVHGHGNVYGTTVFPHNIGLGATRDPDLVKKINHVTAKEVRATGPQWNFAPCICAARDDRWGRTYESFSENPKLVEQFETAIDGLQGRKGQLDDPDRVLASAKHYAGDGDTEYGTGSGDYTIDQGIVITDWEGFWRNSLRQYVPAVRKHHAGSVMPSFSSVDWLYDGVGNPIKMHANRQLITNVLKKKLGFDGFVITDWEGIHQLPGDWATQVRTAVNAGIDMFMEPNSFRDFITTLTAEVEAGDVPMRRINDAVSRILAAKFKLGLFEKPYTPRRYLDEVGSDEHHALARKAAAKSQVLLKNRKHVLPIKLHGKDVYVAGSNADSIGNQAGGWTITWQGGSTNLVPGTTVLDGIEELAGAGNVTYSKDASAPIGRHDTGIVVVGETPYAEGFGDVGGPQWAYDPADAGVPRPPQTMMLNDADQAAVDAVCSAAKTCVVVIVSGRPMILEPGLRHQADAIVAAWLPGAEGAGVADTLFGREPFGGKLPMTWPRTLEQEPINIGDKHYDPLYPYGWGLTTKAWGKKGHGWR